MGSCCVTEGADASVTVTLCHAIDHLLARAGVGTCGLCAGGQPIAQPTLTIEPGALEDAAGPVLAVTVFLTLIIGANLRGGLTSSSP